MSKIKCKDEGVLKSALLFIQPQTGVVLKVWYEDDFDVIEIKDLVLEEINSYKSNPQSYLQQQIGIR